ncbi:MAG: trypsin-like peptidase domain-containing protein [Oscillospiraceae bacterium]|nr:trypsin-like peptidase domain-containing protein [Oscillospiraceae bacterium]
MDDYNYSEKDPWDRGLYETGRTRPPKSHGGLIAVLLVVVIFLSGVVSVLSILNVRLFAQLNSQGLHEDDPVSIVSQTPETTGALNAYEPSVQETDPPAEIEGTCPSFKLNPTPNSYENVPQDGGLSLQQIYEQTIDSVVSISCTLPGGSSTGTGVVLSEDGYIVTNCHVVENAQSVTVQLTDERTFPASLVGADAVSDLAVLRIEAENLTAAQFGDSSAMRVGDSVVAIGDPLGVEFRGSMTDGIVSAINRDVSADGRTLTLIQTNAALNSGNSGGPLINCYGQVIGINTMKISTFVDEAGVEGLGFAIPSATVKEIVEQLVSQGYVSGRPTLGLFGEGVSSFYQYYYRMPSGLYISEVDASSDAARAGIEPGDILISVNNTRISGQEDLNTILYGSEVGDTVQVVIYRSGRKYNVTLTLTESKG